MTTLALDGQSLDTEEAAAAFARDGFLIIPNALDRAEVAALDRAFHQHLDAYPEDFAVFSDSFIEAPDVLPRTTAFDRLIENPRVLPLLKRLIGTDVAFEELALMLRRPVAETGELKGWHRDIIRAYDRRHEIDAISVVYYLTDVGPDDHCFSIIPGTHGPRVDMRIEDVRPGMEVDALGPAGSAFVFHARAIHAGRLKPHSRARRTLHLYYGPGAAPRTSEWTTIPDRFIERGPLYVKARRTASIDGVGRRPRDVDPGLSTAEQLLIVQRRANPQPGATA